MEGEEEYQLKTVSSNYFCLCAYTSTHPQTSQRRWTGNTDFFHSLQELGTNQKINDAADLRQTRSFSQSAFSQAPTAELPDTSSKTGLQKTIRANTGTK